MSEVIAYKDFYAHCDHMPGKDRVLRVGGVVECPTDGWSAKLVRHERSGPPPFSPLTLELDLVLEEPQGEASEVITDIEVEEFSIKDPSFDYHDVHIFGDREHGDGPGQVVVIHTQ